MAETKDTPEPKAAKCWHCAQEIRWIDGEWIDCETHSDCNRRVQGKHVPTPEPSVTTTGDQFNEHGVDLTIAVLRAAIYADDICARCGVRPVGRAWWATFHREYLALAQPTETKDTPEPACDYCHGTRLRQSDPCGPLNGAVYCERGLSCQRGKIAPTPEPSVTTDPWDELFGKLTTSDGRRGKVEIRAAIDAARERVSKQHRDALAAQAQEIADLKKCRHGHEWSNPFGDDWTPDDHAMCDCGTKTWGQRTAK